MKLEDFVTGQVIGVPIQNLDWDKIAKLSDKKFAEFYLMFMKNYDFWEKGIKPRCWECNEPIESPEEFRKYMGQSLHPDCFKKVHSKQRENLSKSDRAYFDRVAKLEY